MTAPFMAPATNGGNAIRTSTERIFDLEDPPGLWTTILPNEHLGEPLFTMDYHLKSKFILTKIDLGYLKTLMTIGAIRAANRQQDTRHPTLNLPITTIETKGIKINCQSNVSIMRTEIRIVTTYLRVQSSSKPWTMYKLIYMPYAYLIRAVPARWSIIVRYRPKYQYVTVVPSRLQRLRELMRAPRFLMEKKYFSRFLQISEYSQSSSQAF